MEKLVSRPSGGGAKLGTLDMQSYLEVMGRQLAEIQAQHHQFYASRHDRVGRVRSHEQAQLKPCSSESTNSAYKQLDGQEPFEEQGAFSDGHSHGEQMQQSPPSTDSGSGVCYATVNQGGARRSLNFAGDSACSTASGMGNGGSRLSAAKDSGGTAGAKPIPDLRAYYSAPPTEGIVGAAALSGLRGAYTSQQPAVSPASLQVPPRAPQRNDTSPQESVSVSGSHSISPSSASIRPSISNPATPSASSAHPGVGASPAAGLATSSAVTSPTGPYAVYDVSGVANISYSTPGTLDGDSEPATSVSASAQKPWRSSRPDAGCSSPSPASQLRGQGAYGLSPSAPSVDSSALAVHGHHVDNADAESVSEDGEVPFALAIAGQAFDGIDSEEDEGSQPSGRDLAISGVGAAAASGRPPQLANASEKLALRRVVPALDTSGIALGRDRTSCGATDSQPRSHSGSRAPLVAASLETEQALRALLASPRFVSGSGAPIGASVEGLEVPDDVLAALAKAEGMDLDAALGAAMATSLRDHPGKPGTAALRPDATQTAQARHHVLVPGALTAAPPAVRGYDASLRSAGTATGRSPGAAVVGTGTGSSLPRGAPLLQPQQLLCGDNRARVSVDASIDVGSVDMLSQTLEMSAEADGVSAAQPILYSLAPRPPVAVGSDCRRRTVDGDSTCGIADGSGRRNTGDGSASAADHVRRRPSRSAITQDAPQTATAAQPSPSAALTSSAAATSDPEPEVGGSDVLGSLHKPHCGSANAASPSAVSPVLRQGVDGDTVLYGSPCQRNPGIDPTSAAAAVWNSPYVPPSPPPGADPSPYMASPPPSHTGSRLKHNSRAAIDELGLGPKDGAGGLEGGGEAAAVSLSVEGAFRPWSAAGGSSRRVLAGSGTSSGANSVNFDLSLTQAAAAVASVAGRPQSAVSSPTTSTRHVRAPTPGPLQVPQQQQQQQREETHQPVYSSFSLAGLSPPAAHAASWDLPANEGHGVSKGAAAAILASQADTVVLDAKGGKACQVHPPPPVVPPLAAFSRAAALAAAADLGLSAPPGPPEGRPRHPASVASGVAASPLAPLEPGASDLPRACDGLLDGQGCADAASSGRMLFPAFGGQASGDSHADAQHSHGQSPEVSVAASAAKLFQLKARRQQQWQSQHGLQGQAAESAAPSAAATPDPKGAQQQPTRSSLGHGYAAADFDRVPVDQASTMDHDRTASTPGWPAGALRGPISSESVVAPSLADAAASPLLPDALAEALARAASGGQDASESGALNLGHGITGLSVAIEAGQVKWAWQTDVKGKQGEGQSDARAGGISPVAGGSRDSSPQSSPFRADVAAGDSGSSWALQQLPPPQWLRHGQMPAGGDQQEAKDGEHERPASDARAPTQQTQLPSHQQLLQRQLEGQYGAMRRHSEYSLPEHPGAKAGTGVSQQHYPHSTGGSSAPSQQHFRAQSASEAGAHGSKALALLRLKQQSILRHHVNLPEHTQSETQPAAQRQETHLQHTVSVTHQPQQLHYPPQQQQRAASADPRTALSRPQRRASAPRMALPISERGDAKPQHDTRPYAGEAEVMDETGAAEAGGAQLQPKAFLRRRSAKVQARKLDWSHVKPRTVSRNPDYYGDHNNPDVVLKTHVSPLTSPKGGVSKPPIGLNVGVRAKKPPSTKLPLSPREEEKAAPLLGAAKRRTSSSNIPAAPGPTSAAGGEKRGLTSVGGPVRGGGLSPLDDLLAHVNTLLRDFDKVVIS